ELESYDQGIPASFITDKPQGLAFAAIGLLLAQVGKPGKQYSRQLFGLILDKLKLDGKKQWRFNVTGGLIFLCDRRYIRVEPLSRSPNRQQATPYEKANLLESS